MAYWLMKSEPVTYGIDHLMAEHKGVDYWDGVRNYQARNFMRDQMRVGDQAFFYHSNCKVPGIVGIVSIVREAYPDHTQWDPESQYYDPSANPDRTDPRWWMVDVRFERQTKRIISLQELRGHSDVLPTLPLLRKGNRLSIMPVSDIDWHTILKLE